MPISSQLVVEKANVLFKTEFITAVKMAKKTLVLKISAGNDSIPCKFQISLGYHSGQFDQRNPSATPYRKRFETESQLNNLLSLDRLD